MPKDNDNTTTRSANESGLSTTVGSESTSVKSGKSAPDNVFVIDSFLGIRAYLSMSKKEPVVRGTNPLPAKGVSDQLVGVLVNKFDGDRDRMIEYINQLAPPVSEVKKASASQEHDNISAITGPSTTEAPSIELAPRGNTGTTKVAFAAPPGRDSDSTGPSQTQAPSVELWPPKFRGNISTGKVAFAEPPESTKGADEGRVVAHNRKDKIGLGPASRTATLVAEVAESHRKEISSTSKDKSQRTEVRNLSDKEFTLTDVDEGKNGGTSIGVNREGGDSNETSDILQVSIRVRAYCFLNHTT